MLRRTARTSCFLVIMLAASFALAQTEFSAEIVDLQKPGTPTNAKIYFAKDKMRIESQSSARTGGAVIVNFATQTSMVLMAQQHMYMEMPLQSQSQRMAYTAAFFQTGDVENACGDWQKIEHNQGSSCHKVGSETVNGRSTVKYETANASGDVSHFWLDPKLRFPVKWEGKNNGGELRNIQEGTQPASLFAAPAGFTKMDMGGMMQRPH
jgi:Domain of unknown function (DUF4412)